MRGKAQGKVTEKHEKTKSGLDSLKHMREEGNLRKMPRGSQQSRKKRAERGTKGLNHGGPKTG